MLPRKMFVTSETSYYAKDNDGNVYKITAEPKSKHVHDGIFFNTERTDKLVQDAGGNSSLSGALTADITTTTAATSPVPVLGILAGLGAAVMLRRR